MKRPASIAEMIEVIRDDIEVRRKLFPRPLGSAWPRTEAASRELEIMAAILDVLEELALGPFTQSQIEESDDFNL